MNSVLLLLILAAQVVAIVLTLQNRKDILMAATRADLDAVLDSITTQISNLGTDLSTTLADIAAKQGTGEDFTPELTKAQAIADQLTSFDATVKTADPGPTPPAGI